MGTTFNVKSRTLIFAPIVKSMIGSAAEPKSSVVSIRTLIFSMGKSETNRPAIIAKMNGFLAISKNTFDIAFFVSFSSVLFKAKTIVVMMIILIVGT